MKTYQFVLALAASATMITGCSVDRVTYSPGYVDTVVYSPGYVNSVYANDDYGTYPSFYWGYQTYYSPVYATGAYRGWGSAYYYNRGAWIRP